MKISYSIQRKKDLKKKKPTKIHECNLQPPSDKTCPRLFVNRLRRPTGTPLTPLALTLLRGRLENIRSKELIFVAFPFHLGLHARRWIASCPSRRQGPPGSLLCPPDKPFISPTPRLGGCSSGAYLPQCCPLHCLALKRTLSKRQNLTPRALPGTARHGPALFTSTNPASYRTSSTLPSHWHSSFRKCGPKKKIQPTTSSPLKPPQTVEVLPPLPSIFPPHLSQLLLSPPTHPPLHLFPFWFLIPFHPHLNYTPAAKSTESVCGTFRRAERDCRSSGGSDGGGGGGTHVDKSKSRLTSDMCRMGLRHWDSGAGGKEKCLHTNAG